MRGHAQYEVRGWHVLAALLAFFGLVIAVNTAFIVTAIGSFPGEDVKRSYLQGLNYNATLEKRDAQTQLGWQAEAALVSEAGGAVLGVDLHDRFGAPLDGLILQGALRWPADSKKDRALSFRSKGGGRYEASLPDLHAGRWRLRARASDASGGALDFEADLLWPIPR